MLRFARLRAALRRYLKGGAGAEGPAGSLRHREPPGPEGEAPPPPPPPPLSPRSRHGPSARPRPLSSPRQHGGCFPLSLPQPYGEALCAHPAERRGGGSPALSSRREDALSSSGLSRIHRMPSASYMQQGREEVQRPVPSGTAFRNYRCVSSHQSLSRCQGILFFFSLPPERFRSLPPKSLLLLCAANPEAEHYSKVLPVLLSAGE